MITSRKQMALLLAQQGLRIFPVHSIRHGMCDCGKEDCNAPGKHPHWHPKDLPNGLHSATVDLTQLMVWFDRWPYANIGIATGKASNLAVVDCDGEKGLENYKKLTEGMNLQPTFTVQTGGGGVHYYFRANGLEIPSRNDETRELCIDFKAEGGYVIGPASRHISGNFYTILNGGGPIAPLQTEVIGKLFDRYGTSLEKVALPASSLSSSIEVRLTEQDWQKDIYQGSRDVMFTRLVGQFLVNNRSLPLSTIMNMLMDQNLRHCKPPMSEEQVRKIILSIAHRETIKNKDKEIAKEESKFRIMTTQEMFDSFSNYKEQWDVKDFLPAATVGILGAATQTYKTWMMLSLSYALSTGGKFLGHYPALNKGKVLIVQQEDPMPLLIKRLSTIMKSAEDPKLIPDILWHPDAKLHISDLESMEALERTIRDEGVKWVFIDPVYSMAPLTDYMAGAAQSLLQLKALRDKYGVTFMLVHHTTNDGNDLWGSQFIKAWRETAWMAKSLTPTTIQLDRHTKGSAHLSSLEITFDITDFHFKCSVETIDDEKAESNRKVKRGSNSVAPPRNTKEEIERQILKGNVTSKAELADMLGISATRVTQLFKELDIVEDEGVFKFDRD